jgi:hypothetical protein
VRRVTLRDLQPVTSRRFTPGDFEGQMAANDLQIARAGENPRNLRLPELSRYFLLNQRYKKVKDALKGPLTRGTRLRLTQELAELTPQRREAARAVRNVFAGRAPDEGKATAADRVAMEVAQAGLTDRHGR